MNNEKLTYQP